ncbi:unnamed protein product [Caenorhabditis sp. 36 PRJEB53466]|nr:unnamed protein product [Caenorhabditis sp. 36 PRJEB53466]
MVEITVTSPPGTSRNVTFESPDEKTEIENQIIAKVQEVLGNQYSREVILQAIHTHSEPKNDDTFMGQIIDDLFKENKSDEPIIGPIFRPDLASTSTNTTDSLAVIPYDPNHISNTNMNMEEMIRDPNVSVGLANSGNTCWFNCLAQVLYSLPRFRSILYHCVPYTWKQQPIVNIRRESLLYAELLLGFRTLLAELQFTELTYLTVDPELHKLVDRLYHGERSKNTSIGRQQDASEMFMLILEWLRKGLYAALHSQLHPEERLEAADENLVVADSTAEAPNSDVTGTLPPDYDSGMDALVTSTSSAYREAKSRPNSPVKKNTISGIGIPHVDGSLFGASHQSLKNELPSIEEAMDTSEGVLDHSSRRARTSPPPKASRIEVDQPVPEVSDAEKNFVESLLKQFKDIFQFTCITQIIDNATGLESVEQKAETESSPLFLNLQMSFGNMHDALEAATFDFTRYEGSHARSLYSTMPAVLFMNLSRFNYEQGANKLHNTFKFPRNMYMDRYLYSNLDTILELRKKQLALREQLSVTKSKLAGLQKYPQNDGTSTRLATAFETVLEALRNVRLDEKATSLCENDNVVCEPLLPSTSSASSPICNTGSLVEDLGKKFPSFDKEKCPTLGLCADSLEAMVALLVREETELSQRVAQLEDEINNIYEVDSLHKKKYELQALIIHAGEANSGHYWTYRLKRTIDGTEKWEKINDKTTEEVSWDKVESDSFGSGTRSSPSAYMLMYVLADAHDIIGADNMTESEAIKILPNDMQEMVALKRAQIKEAIRRFRQEKSQTPGQYQKAPSSTFTWYRVEEQPNEGDENANPTGRLPVVTDRLDEYPIVIATDLEIDRVTQMIARMWNYITNLEPNKFKDSQNFLEYHLERFWFDLNGAKSFLETKLGYPLDELREDAENDIDKVFNAYLTEYIPSVLDGIKFNNRSSLLFFVHTSFPHLNVAVVRFLMLYAMHLANVRVLSTRAQIELLNYEERFRDSCQRTLKVSYLLVHIYEVGCLETWATRSSLENFKATMDRKKGSRMNARMEHCFNAMYLARMARVAEKIIYEETKCFSDNSLKFVKTEVIQTASILSVIAAVKQLLHNLTNQTFTVFDMEFLHTELDRRIKWDEIIKEVRLGIARIHTWFRESEEEKQIHDITAPQEIKELDIASVYSFVNTAFEMVYSCAPVTSSTEKLMLVTEIREALTILEENREKPSRLIEANTSDASVELEKVAHIRDELFPIQDRVTKISNDVQEIVGSIFG